MTQFHQALQEIKHLIINHSLEESYELQQKSAELIDSIDAITFIIAKRRDKLINIAGIETDAIEDFIVTNHPPLHKCENEIVEIGKKLLIETKEIESVSKDISQKIQRDEKDLSNIIRLGVKKNLLNEES